MLLGLVLVAIVKISWKFSIKSIRNVKRVILKRFQNDNIIIKMRFCNNAHINVHVLKTWIKD